MCDRYCLDRIAWSNNRFVDGDNGNGENNVSRVSTRRRRNRNVVTGCYESSSLSNATTSQQPCQQQQQQQQQLSPANEYDNDTDVSNLSVNVASNDIEDFWCDDTLGYVEPSTRIPIVRSDGPNGRLF